MWSFKKDYVFLICNDKILFDSPEDKSIKKKIFDYINTSIKSFFFDRNIQYVDYYHSKTGLDVYTVISTTGPENKKNRFLALLYEIFAFSLSKESRIFDSYNPEIMDFENEVQKVKVYKFKI